MAQRDEIVLAGKKVRLPEDDLVFDQRRRLYNNKNRFTVCLQLWALVRSPRILHGEFMQAKLLLHFVEQRIVRLVESDPEENVRLFDDLADIVNRERFKALTVLIGDTIYDGGFNDSAWRTFVASGGWTQLRVIRLRRFSVAAWRICFIVYDTILLS